MPLNIGSRLGTYEIVDLLGAGGMGEVYRARDTRLGREVAIKVLPPDLARRPDALARFEREARAVAALSHPGILAIHDFGTTNGVTYAVMELLDGESLREALVDGPLPPRRAIDFAAQIARAVAAAHDKGIVHRDIKPENVFVTSSGQVKILDFGLARHDPPGTDVTQAATLQSPSVPGIVMGTVGYMAPEQVRGATVDSRADIFAFGAMLYEMLTGRRPFARETPAETMTAILREDVPEMGGGTPVAIERIIRRCLEKKPEARFRSAEDLAFALDAIGGTSTASMPATSAPATHRARTGSRAPIVAALAAVALAALGGAWYGRQSTGNFDLPRFRQITFEDAIVTNARFAPDGQTIVYSEQRGFGEPPRLLITRLDSAGVTPLAAQHALLLAISKQAEILVILNPAMTRAAAEPNPGKLVRLPLFGGAPREVLDDVTYADWNADGSAIAVVRVVGSQQRLEYPVGTVLFTTEGEIGYPRVSPSGDQVAFLDWPVKNDDRGNVAIVDRTGRQQRIAGLYEAARGLAWTPDGREVWFGAAVGTNDYELRAAGIGRPERRLHSSPAGLLIYDIDPAGRALVAEYNRSLYIELSTQGEAKARDVSWRSGSFVRDISGDGRKVLLSYFGQGSSPNYDVYVRDVGVVDATKIGEGQPQQFSPDERSVLTVVHGPPSRVVILPIGAGEATTISTGQVVVTAARWLPDGKRLLVVGTEPSKRVRAYVTGVAAGTPRPITPEGITLAPDMIALTEDGTRLAVQSPDGAVMIYPTSGDGPTPVSGLLPGEIPIGWTPGDRALVVRDAQNRRRLVGVDPTTGQRMLFREFVPSDSSLAGPGLVSWTPDGRTFAALFQRRTITVHLLEGLK